MERSTNNKIGSNVYCLALFMFCLFTAGALYYISIKSQGLHQHIALSIETTQQKTNSVNGLAQNIRNRSFILLSMLNERDPFALDELNQTLYREAFLFRENRDKLKANQLSVLEDGLLNHLLELTAANAENQAAVANFLLHENKEAAEAILFDKAIPNQTKLHTIIKNFISTSEENNRAALSQLQLKIQDNQRIHLFLSILLSFCALIFMSVLIKRIQRDKSKSIDKKIINDNVIESALDAIILTNDDELITVFNKSACKLFGYTTDEIINQPISLLLPKIVSSQLSTWVTNNAQQSGIQREGHAYHKDQSTIPVQVTLSDTGIHGNQRFSLIIRDLSTSKENELRISEKTRELDEALARYKKLSETDSLTKIPNRRAYENRLADEINISKRSKTTLAMVVFDIDCFKEYNDFYGHDQGDAVLQKVANVISETLPRSTDFTARFGGEEFVVILPSTDSIGARQVAEKIRANIEALAIKHQTSKTYDVVTVSAGVATLCGGPLNAASLFRRADTALYKAKEEGKNCTRIFNKNDVLKLDTNN